jgi:RNA polymerase sigma-70 factor, ECF subfamily
MGYREIGELLNISEDAAKKRGQRLVKKLQKLYEER